MRPSPLRAILPALLLCVGLGGCAVFHVFDSAVHDHGATVKQDALRELIPGTSSRADVLSLIGSPTAHATFDDNKWLYISQDTYTRIGRTPGILHQKVVILTFDQNGVLENIDDLTKANAKSIAMAAGATPSPGTNASFLQQLFGNVGKFTPAGLPGSNGAFGSGPASQQPGYSGNSLH